MPPGAQGCNSLELRLEMGQALGMKTSVFSPECKKRSRSIALWTCSVRSTRLKSKAERVNHLEMFARSRSAITAGAQYRQCGGFLGANEAVVALSAGNLMYLKDRNRLAADIPNDI